MRLSWTLLTVAVIATVACNDDDGESASTAAASTSEVPTATAAPTATTDSVDVTTSTPTTEPPTPPSPVSPSSVTTPCGSLTVGLNEVTLTAGGADHPVRVFVPSAYAGAPLPTVVNWHGLGSNGPEQAALSDYEALAEAEGFIVAHPTGVPSPDSDANSWELADLVDPERDDIAFANALIDELTGTWCADPSRIYSTGMSNGGFFTARLLCEIADRIAAASSVAGTYHPDGCAPSRPVPYLSFHGTDDRVVPFAGGGESILNTENDPELRVFFEQVMPDEFAEFAADAGCAAEPDVTDIGDEVIRYDYPGCDAGTPMSFFEITGGGHTWPSSPLAAQVAGVLGHTTDDVDATADSWEFFQRHTLDR